MWASFPIRTSPCPHLYIPFSSLPPFVPCFPPFSSLGTVDRNIEPQICAISLQKMTRPLFSVLMYFDVPLTFGKPQSSKSHIPLSLLSRKSCSAFHFLAWPFLNILKISASTDFTVSLLNCPYERYVDPDRRYGRFSGIFSMDPTDGKDDIAKAECRHVKRA